MTDTLNPLALNELLDRPQPKRETDDTRSESPELVPCFRCGTMLRSDEDCFCWQFDAV